MIKCPVCGSSKIYKDSKDFRCRNCGYENKEVNLELDKFLGEKDEKNKR